ncbi:MAG: hypothetical protein ACOYO1_16590 [Bacteroidales bacterium]
MNYFKEKKIAFWTIIILVILNISTLSMMWIHRPPHHPPPPPHLGKLIPDLIIEELRLDQNQRLAFDESEQQQMRKINPLLDSLHHSKQNLFLSVFEEKIDTVKMNANINQIGRISEEIDKVTFFHVSELKKICNPKQQQMLEELFRDMGKHRRGKRESELSE